MINEEIERYKRIPRINANLAQSRSNPVHFRTQNYRSLMVGYQKGKMAEKPQLKTAKNRAVKNWLNKENIIFLWLGRVSKLGEY